MLSDNSEKSRNPIKKAMRRRNAKTVQFAAPTYVEASDYDYSSDEEEAGTIDGNYSQGQTAQVEDASQNGQGEEPAKPEAKTDDHEERLTTPTNRGSFDREQAATHTPSIDEPQLSPRLVDKTEAAPLKKTKGSPRNRDSFLKDDTETRKISLTPGLLREDSTSTRSISSESGRGSTEAPVKITSQPEQMAKKDAKKEKEKKQKGGMLSGLFKSKKKDKKAKEEAEGDVEKVSNEIVRQESPKHSLGGNSESSAVGRAAPPSAIDPRQASQPRAAQQAPVHGQPQKQPSTENAAVQETPAPQQQPLVTELEGSMGASEMSAVAGPIVTEATQRVGSAHRVQDASATARELVASSSPGQGAPAESRMQLGDPESTDEEGDPNPFKEQEQRQRQSEEQQRAMAETSKGERLSESPVQVSHAAGGSKSFMDGTEIVHIPEGMIDEDDDDDDDAEEPGSLTSSPSIIEHPSEAAEEGEKPGTATAAPVLEHDDDPTPTAPRSPQPTATEAPPSTTEPAGPVKTPTREASTSTTSSSIDSSLLSPPSTIPSVSEQHWDDTHLRSWLDDGSEIRDFLVLVNDKSGVKPVGEDHPMMKGLFVEERGDVGRMVGELDELLGGWARRRGLVLG